MLNRWNSILEDLNVFIDTAKGIVEKITSKLKKKRGRPPKRKIKDYLLLIVTKEFDKKSLRGAEKRLSKDICKERIDHSVIAYWENKPEVAEHMKNIINEIGKELDKRLGWGFSVIDSTKFSNWKINEVEFHVVNRVNHKTVYPVGISFLTDSVASPTRESTPEGGGKLYADAWYDDNKTIGVLFNKGYTPIICPNKNRWKGYWRKKARKLYRQRENRLGYRQRGRGESPFGSLTNAFGDRIKTLEIQTTKTRIVARVIVYQIKLLMRLKLVFIVNY